VKATSLRTFLLIAGGVLALLAAANARYYFAAPMHELGDIAVNSLQIDQARRFAEIHGNYSRFYFDHPGPAFFYVYALGEYVLFDWLHLAASPQGAHALAGLALQAAFLGLALTLMASWIRSPLFLPLALLAGAVHFSLATNALVSIWPPHVLVMPFLAFWIACVSVAAGRGRHLPWAVLAGGFLVHGHVVQILFVAVLAGCAYIAGWRRLRCAAVVPARPWRAFPAAHAWALGILLVFLFPLAVDLTRGAASNAGAVVQYLLASNEPPKSVARSFGYLLSFLSYRHDQDRLFPAAGAADLSFVRSEFWVWLLWLAALGGAGRVLVRRPDAAAPGAAAFLRTMPGFAAITAALCVIWGIRQEGPMWEFNGFFYYGFTYALLLLFVGLAVAAIPRPPPRWLALPPCGLAALIAAWGLRLPALSGAESGLPLRAATLAALAQDPRPAAPKLLAFPHDDWPPVASAALALERAGRHTFVGSGWTFMFQRAHEVPRRLLTDPDADLSVWRFVRDAAPGEGVGFVGGLRILFAPGALSPVNGRIEFTPQGNWPRYLVCGIATPGGADAWTESPDVALQFRPEPADHDVDLEITADPFVSRHRVEVQRGELWFNGVLVGQAALQAPGVLRARIPRELWNRKPVALVYLHLPDARSPAEFRLSGDPRILAWSIRSLTATPAPP